MIGLGMTSGLALSYSTFGGAIEHLAGFAIEASTVVEASRFDSSSLSDDLLPPLFQSTMTGYGLPPEPDGTFFPFVRGFWGD
jgi:hypothetical protein